VSSRVELNHLNSQNVAAFAYGWPLVIISDANTNQKLVKGN